MKITALFCQISWHLSPFSGYNMHILFNKEDILTGKKSRWQAHSLKSFFHSFPSEPLGKCIGCISNDKWLKTDEGHSRSCKFKEISTTVKNSIKPVYTAIQ